ncbi:MAG: ATP-dependent Clp protease ATP-binding subunit [Spirochaetes bacterium]|nr:ATP-dependent Clp protease ATP-binding subunit [Spirochaetota bacterium]
MYNRGFTSRANRIIRILAQEEAKKYNADKLEPEHVVLAILKDEIGVAVKTLLSLGVDIPELIEDIEEFLVKKESPVYLGDVLPSPQTQKMLEVSAEQAKNMGYSYIGTEHLMLAAMHDQASVVNQVFEEHNINPLNFKEAIVKIIGFGKTEIKKEIVKKTPTLDEFGRDLTQLAHADKLDKVIGREVEIERVVQILTRRTKNNPVLIGHPGVGKTAIVEGLAQRIIAKNVPDVLQDMRVVSLDLGLLVAGTKYRGEFEERMKKIMKEIKDVENIILFIDELHTIIGAGAAEGAIDASNMLKPALSRGEVQCIGATTLNEYKKHIEKDAALERRFQSVHIEEPSVEETIKILTGIKYLYEKHHNVQYTNEAIEDSAKMSKRYLTERFLPDKAIDLLDEAGSKARLKKSGKPGKLIQIENEISELSIKKNKLIKEQLFEECIEIKDRIQKLTNDKENLLSKWQKNVVKEKIVVDREDIAQLISHITKIPLARIEESESTKLLNIEEILHQRVVGQEDAIKAVASSIRRSRLGLSSKKRAMGSFVFLGPTGVGKTELARTLAEYLFGDESFLIRLDMSDFMEKHNVSRLIGAPPGYVGYEEGGLLTEKVRRQPYSVILFDEIEKAHPDVFNILLQILEEGELADNLNHRVSFRNTIIIMTSNVGAREINKDRNFGFSLTDNEIVFKEIKTAALNELKRFFSPEFINRIDDIVVFHPLCMSNLYQIIDIMFKEISDNMEELNITLELTQELKDFLITKHYDKKFGARPLRRALQKEVADPFSIEMLTKKVQNGDKVIVTIIDDEIKFIIKNQLLTDDKSNDEAEHILNV